MSSEPRAVHRSGSARGFVAVYSTLGLLRLRLGALPEADAAARVALRVLQEGDFAPGLAFAATVLADVAVEAGELDEAQALIELLPQEGWPAGVGTVLFPSQMNSFDGVGRIDPATGQVQLADTDPYLPSDIAFGADGGLWFVDNGANDIGRITISPSLFPSGGGGATGGSVPSAPAVALTLRPPGSPRFAARECCGSVAAWPAPAAARSPRRSRPRQHADSG